MTFGESIKTCFAKFVTWQGRASRSEFWFFILFQVIVTTVARILDNMLGLNFSMMNPVTGMEQSMGYGYLYLLAALVLFLPSLAVMVRRLHDTDRSGWWYWIVLTIIGIVVLIVWLATRGTPGPNKYGEDPLASGTVATFA